MSVAIFALLGTITPEEGSGRTRSDELRNAIFSTVAFVLGAITSIIRCDAHLAVHCSAAFAGRMKTLSHVGRVAGPCSACSL